ncbi:2-dehydro-3-deoxygalactonokinase [Gayadomonas joobiniege]|uniref:2-dehydro-3-deoxygalactonokinase n=1 Tax=Gayadomonas joobiniege TaxID=1234606 RepID=UPI00036F6E1B|nr:2-dehydro-3-deoxygalactonokinase [Gayadomonas joobiniege]
MLDANELSFLALDWGTTNFRAFAFDVNGKVIAEKQAPMGLLQISDGQFAHSLANLLNEWISQYQTLPIIMAGMVGSAQGWHPVEYCAAPVDLSEIQKHYFEFNLPWGAKAKIVPGVSFLAENGMYDVMRGEEVQLFGLQQIARQHNMQAVFPGTHSKQVVIKNGKIVRFETYMTGELFSILNNHSLLGRGLPKQISCEKSFLKGVALGQNQGLSHLIFAARTSRLFNQVADTAVADFLSGVMIGYESQFINADTIYLVGGEALEKRYRLACESRQINVKAFSGDECFIAGIKQLQHLV